MTNKVAAKIYVYLLEKLLIVSYRMEEYMYKKKMTKLH